MFRTRTLGHLAACSLLLVAAFASGNVFAAAASATSSVFDLSATPGVLAFSNASFLVDVSTPARSGFDVGSAPASFSFNDGNSFAAGAAEDEFTGLPSTTAGAVTQGRAASTVMWFLDWTATQTGTATVSLEYLSSYTVSNLLAGETGIASSYISLLVDGTSYQSEVLNFFSNVNGNNFIDSTLALVFPVIAGQHGSLTITLASNAIAAPVPLPAALWLLLSGVAGLAGFVRRKQSG